MTSGEELKIKLGLSEFRYTPYIRILNVAGYYMIVIFYDTRRPNVPITTYDIRKYNKVLSVQRYPFEKEAPSGPVQPLELLTGPLTNVLIVAVDLAGRYGDRSKQIKRDESVSKDSKLPKLNEWMTFQNLNTLDSISNFTKYHRKVRNKAVKTENFTAKLMSCEYNDKDDSVMFIFKTTATTPIYKDDAKFKKVNPVDFTMEDNPDKEYEVRFRILDFMKWLKDTRPDALNDKIIDWKEIKEVLKVAYVQVWCNCPAFYYQGIDYWLSQLDGAIYPTDIEPKRWNDPNLHGDGNAFLCKHSYGIVRQIGFFANQMVSMLNKKLKEQGLI